jgi:hypothetical protein
MHCDDFLLSPPGPPLFSSALGCGCLRRTGALPLTPTRGAAPGPRLGLCPKNPSRLLMSAERITSFSLSPTAEGRAST